MNILTISQAWAAGAFEILLMLIVAFLLGLLLGYLIWNRKENHSSDTGNLNLETELKDVKTEKSRLDSEVTVLKSQKSTLEADLKACREKNVLAASAPVSTTTNLSASAPTSAKKDELKKVEGIGPKIQELFYNNGIFTFNQMAGTESSRLKEILDTAGPRMQMHDPTSWPKQARLAADGKWDELKILQDELKGGK